jgi:hypothetical protein
VRADPERLLPWLLRAGWVAMAVVAAAAIDGATADRSAAVHGVARFGGAALWLAGVVAMAIPSVIGLTATRLIVPIAVPAAIVTLVAGADAAEGVGFLVAAVVVVLLAYSGDFGRAFAQGSAYGHERRYPLRPPAAYALVSAVTWGLWAACLLAGPLLLAARQWVPGAVLSALAAAGVAWAWPRWHRLSRRWLVVVPAGLVVHDHLVLAETLMLRRGEIAAVRLAPADTGALDLTGPAAGHAVEIVTREPATAILGSTPRQPGGRPVHFTACLVAPSRPGRALAAAVERRISVG